MYLLLSLPILVVNLIFTIIALHDIWKHYEYSTFKPRLALVVVIIAADIPYSVIFVVSDLINNGFLNNDTLCYIYVLLAHFYVSKFFALMALAIFIGLIMFTTYSVVRLNRIGWWLNLMVLSLFLFFEFVLIFMSGWTQMDFDDQNRPKRCIAATGFLFTGSGYLSFVCTAISMTASIVFLVENRRTNKLQKGTSSNRISISFFFFAVANLFAMSAWTIDMIRGKEFEMPLKWIIMDIATLVPTCFAVIYLLTEAWGRLSNLNFGISRILKIKKCRMLFKGYLSDIGAKKSFELISKWETLSRGSVDTMDVLDRPGLNKKEATDYIEKYLDLEVYGFLLTESFNDFYITYNMGGRIEANLAEEVEQQHIYQRGNPAS